VGSGATQPFALTPGAARPAEWPRTAWRAVGNGYFRTLAIPLTRGDGFDAHRSLPRAAIVNEQFVRMFLAGRDPLGERIHFVSSPRADAPDPDAWTIIGVVGDAHEEYSFTPVPPAVYVRFADTPASGAALLAHTAGPPLALANPLRDAVAGLDPDQPVYGIRDLAYMISSELDLSRLALVLLALFSATALVLSIAGVYGVVAHSVGQRLREMGVRLALGAVPHDVLRLIVGDALRYAVIGATAGLAVVLATGERLSSLTPSWGGIDLRIPLAAAVAVTVTALVSAYLPARRATAVDPAIVLRDD
jgi:putative ABC transport system permease protein